MNRHQNTCSAFTRCSRLLSLCTATRQGRKRYRDTESQRSCEFCSTRNNRIRCHSMTIHESDNAYIADDERQRNEPAQCRPTGPYSMYCTQPQGKIKRRLLSRVGCIPRRLAYAHPAPSSFVICRIAATADSRVGHASSCGGASGPVAWAMAATRRSTHPPRTRGDLHSDRRENLHKRGRASMTRGRDKDETAIPLHRTPAIAISAWDAVAVVLSRLFLVSTGVSNPASGGSQLALLAAMCSPTLILRAIYHCLSVASSRRQPARHKRIRTGRAPASRLMMMSLSTISS